MKPVKDIRILDRALLLGIGENNYSGMYHCAAFKNTKKN